MSVVAAISRKRHLSNVGILTADINSTEEAGGACRYTSTGHLNIKDLYANNIGQ
jgi:Tfp pilus assembly ATPase PilU